jgi:peptidoglycan/xylan/chitin deacetylase (PgdA/CDA1 family)
VNRRALLTGILAGGLTPPARAQAPSLLPVLTYHRFSPGASTSATIVSTPVFAHQMAWLAANHVRVAPLRETIAVAHGTKLAAPTVAITADDGWRSVYTEMFPILREHRFHATLFINPPSIGHGGAYLTWPMLAEMVQSGLVDVQAHTLSHPNFNTERARHDPAAYQAYLDHEIAGSRTAITANLGLPADLLAWPFGLHDPQLEAAAQKAGFAAAYALGSSAITAGSPDFALPRYQIYDTDRDVRFAWIVAGNPRQPLHKKVTT